jgi:hypothetical protein
LVDIEVAGWPAVDAIYASVRDAQWGTVRGATTSVSAVSNHDGSSVVLRARYVADPVDFESTMNVTVTGDTITVVFDGLALSDFDANRVGLSVLHPLSLVGAALTATTDGGDAHIRFTERIDPHVLATDLVGMAYDVAPGIKLMITFEGELFEIEDHRNWTDPGWKTYCTPLHRAHPVRLSQGQRVHQQIVLRATTSREPTNLPSMQVAEPRQLDRVDVRDLPAGTLPALGVVVSGSADTLDAYRDVVRYAMPTNLHVELEEGTAWRADLTFAATLAAERDLGLSVTAISRSEPWFCELAGVLADNRVSLVRLCLVNPDTYVTAPGCVPSARQALRALGCESPVGGGSILHFAELNRLAQPTDAWDFASFAVTPQAHQCDDASILSTVRAQPYALADARAITGCPVVVSPITLRARRAPTLRASVTDPADPRETTALGATWMLASIAAMGAATGLDWLVDAGADARPTQRADLNLLRSLTSWAGQPTLSVTCSTDKLAALAFRRRPGIGHVMVANLAPEATDVQVNRSRIRLGGYDWASLDVDLDSLSPRIGAVSSAT